MKKILYLFLIISFVSHAQNVVFTETFSSCTPPSGYVFAKTEGVYGFSIARSTLIPKGDASCSIYYLQSIQNDNAQRTFDVSSPTFPLMSFSEHTVRFDLRFTRSSNSTLTAYTIINNQKTLLQSWNSDIKDNITIMVPQQFNVPTPITGGNIKLQFEYQSPTSDFATNIIIDNFTIQGADNDDCSKAFPITFGTQCLNGNVLGAEFKGPALTCTGTYVQAVWYSFDSPISGYVRLKTNAKFNDAISFFEGTCTSLQQITCNNTDEYGFTGERNFYNVAAGKKYFFRMAKQIDFYGTDANAFCILLQKEDPLPPIHDICSVKIPLQINQACPTHKNIQAGMENTIPSKNIRSRADIWYSFKAISTNPLEIVTNANFADVLAVFSGNCNALVEVQSEDLGGKLVLSNPKVGTEYFIQVSGYFSTIEGDLCIEVKDKSSLKPTNEDCPTARAIVLNQSCNTISTVNASISTRKPSCTVYNGPDVWYSFITTTQKDVVLNINAGFIFNWGVYRGTSCNTLVEVDCGISPDPCDGPIKLISLELGKTYYLQIIAASRPLKPGEGNLCVAIEDAATSGTFTPLDLDLQVECLHGVLGKVNYTATGGNGQLNYSGPSNNEIFYPGTVVEAYIEDESGCRDFESAEIGCVSPSKCKNSNLDIEVLTECIIDSLGRQTGEVLINSVGKGGSGVYYLYGTPNGATLKHGNLYNIILIDSDSCYIIEEGKINCPPFDCSQSALKVNVQYTCVDTLLKAILQLDVEGALGTYQLSGNQHGTLLSQGDKYSVEVTDQAGCKSITTGEIKCHFDSCAYARPTLEVNYECLKDQNGKLTGKAELKVNGSSKAGNISYLGNQPGEILNHADNYSVTLHDSFGCEIKKEGQINCIVVGIDPSGVLAKYSYELVPNPTNGNTNLSFNLDFSEKVNVFIYNSSGKELSNREFTGKQGRNSMEINSTPYRSGIYYIKVKTKERSQLLRFVKI